MTRTRTKTKNNLEPPPEVWQGATNLLDLPDDSVIGVLTDMFNPEKMMESGVVTPQRLKDALRAYTISELLSEESYYVWQTVTEALEQMIKAESLSAFETAHRLLKDRLLELDVVLRHNTSTTPFSKRAVLRDLPRLVWRLYYMNPIQMLGAY